jgi:hypothetical protein
MAQPGCSRASALGRPCQAAIFTIHAQKTNKKKMIEYVLLW